MHYLKVQINLKGSLASLLEIESGSNDDYIHYSLRKADGTYIPVLDQGRIVESEHFGRVFYVLFMDWQAMQDHYGTKFGEKDV